MKKIFLCIICGLLVFSLFGCARFEYTADRCVTYSSTLKTLLNQDYSSFYDFVMHGSLEKWRSVSFLRCKDCRLTRGYGMNGTADILADTFFEEGLVEYNEHTNKFYDRFREDYVFCVEFYNGQAYYFVSYSDALKWIELNCS